MIMLNSKAQLTVDIVAKVAERKISVDNAAKILNNYYRHCHVSLLVWVIIFVIAPKAYHL